MLELEEGEDKKWTWTVKDGDKGVAAGGLHDTKHDALKSFFGILFGTFDADNFMDLYGEWQAGLPKPERIANSAV